MKGLVSETDSALKQLILEEGFKKKGHFFYRQGISDDFQDMLGFNFATYHTGRQISPHVYIYNSTLDRLYLRLCEKKNKPGYPGMCLLGCNIGYLFPDHNYFDWFFQDFSEIPQISKTIIKKIKKYVYPFFKEYQNIEKIIEVYENKTKGFGIDISTRFYKQPLLYSAIGEHDKGIELIELIKQTGFIELDSQKTFYDNYIKYAMEQKGKGCNQ